MIEQPPNNIQPPALNHQIISMDNLTFLPNLYYRKYKMIQKLTNFRSNFPEQRILIQRQPTSWDFVIKEAKEKQRQMNEIKKFKIVQKYQLAKSMKDKIMKNDLKKEELYLYHRLIASSLSQGIRNKFQQYVTIQNKIDKNDIKMKKIDNSNINANKDATNVNIGINNQNQTSAQKQYNSNRQNDIFLEDNEQREYNPQGQYGGDGLFDDILQGSFGDLPPDPSANVRPTSTQNNRNDAFGLDGPDVVQPPAVQRGQSISNYLKKYIDSLSIKKDQTSPQKLMSENQDPQNLNQEENKLSLMSQLQLLLHQKNLMINRKQCLKKINDDLRKRNKNKGNQSTQSSSQNKTIEKLVSGGSSNTQTKSFGSASIALNLLINSEIQIKPQESIEVPSILQPSLYTEVQRAKRKKDDIFQLKWSEDKMQELKNANPQFDPKKTKFDSSLLALYLIKSQEQYHKIFEKSIKTKKNFPSHLKDIPEIKSIFSKNYNFVNSNQILASQIGQQYYYNEFYDRDYQLFLMKNSKQKVMQKFIKASDYIFPQNYAPYDYYEDSNTNRQILSNEPLSIGKLFVNPTPLKNKQNRVIYKFHKNQLTALVKSSSLSKNLEQFNRNYKKIGKDHLILLSFLVRRYLSLYGNNWSLITQCIRMNFCFNHLMLTQEMIQQLYQYVELKRNLENVRFIKGVKKEQIQNNQGQKKDVLKYKRSLSDRNRQDQKGNQMNNKHNTQLIQIEQDMQQIDDDDFGFGEHNNNSLGGNKINLTNNNYSYKNGGNSYYDKNKIKRQEKLRLQNNLQSLGKLQVWQRKVLPFNIYTQSSYQKSGQNLEAYNFVNVNDSNYNNQFKSSENIQRADAIHNKTNKKNNMKKAESSIKSNKNSQQENSHQSIDYDFTKDQKFYERLLKHQKNTNTNKIKNSKNPKLIQSQNQFYGQSSLSQKITFKTMNTDFISYLKQINIDDQYQKTKQQQSNNNNKMDDELDLMKLQQDALLDLSNNRKSSVKQNQTKDDKGRFSHNNVICTIMRNDFIRNQKHFTTLEKYSQDKVYVNDQHDFGQKKQFQKMVKSQLSNSDASDPMQKLYASRFIQLQNQREKADRNDPNKALIHQHNHIHIHRPKVKKVVNEKTSELVRVLQTLRKGQNQPGIGGVPMPANMNPGMIPQRQIPNMLPRPNPMTISHVTNTGNIQTVTIDPPNSVAQSRPSTHIPTNNPPPGMPINPPPITPNQSLNLPSTGNANPQSADNQSVKGNKGSSKKEPKQKDKDKEKDKDKDKDKDKQKKDATPEKKVSRPKKKLKKEQDKQPEQ